MIWTAGLRIRQGAETVSHRNQRGDWLLHPASFNLFRYDAMMRLDKASSAWGRPDFEVILKQEIEKLSADQLPLQQGLSVGSYALAEPVTATILAVAEMEKIIRVKAGIFFSSVIAGCSCADDPSPIDKISEYCVVQIDIDKATGAATVNLVPEQAS